MARTAPNQDRVEGFGDKAKGRMKDARGALTGDRSLHLLRKLFR
jgi:uncharacterized protein YjbJ (UPF0337 family)